MARATPHRRYDAVLNDRISTFLAAAEDRAEDAAQYLPAELGADRARRALRQCFDHALRLAATTRTRLAEKDVRHRVRAMRGLGRLCRRSAFELFVRRFAVSWRVVLARNRGAPHEIGALAIRDRPKLAGRWHDIGPLDHA